MPPSVATEVAPRVVSALSARVSVMVPELGRPLTDTLSAIQPGADMARGFASTRAAAALTRPGARRAKVIRDCRAIVLPAAEAMRDDLLMIETADLVDAGSRQVDACALRANEAALTKDSEPVRTEVGELATRTALADRPNLVFLKTGLAAGSGRAYVVASGITGELGHIARLLACAGSDIPPGVGRGYHG